MKALTKSYLEHTPLFGWWIHEDVEYIDKQMQNIGKRVKKYIVEEIKKKKVTITSNKIFLLAEYMAMIYAWIGVHNSEWCKLERDLMFLAQVRLSTEQYGKFFMILYRAIYYPFLPCLKVCKEQNLTPFRDFLSLRVS